MPLKLAIGNGDKHIDNMTIDELNAANKLASDMSFTERGVFYRQLLKPSMPVLQYSITNPDWLESDFKDNAWHCRFGKRKTAIFFNIHLEDGSKLTDPQHHKLLYTFKYWICCQTYPLYNGGHRLKPGTKYTKVRQSLHIIDGILLQSNHFQLAKCGLNLITIDDTISLLRMISLGISEGLYKYSSRLSSFLKLESKGVSEEELSKVIQRFPSILEHPEEYSLDFTHNELVRAKAWLVLKNAYSRPESAHQSNGACSLRFTREQLYTDTLRGLSMSAPASPELRITPVKSYNELPAVPIHAEHEVMSKKELSAYMSALKLFRLARGEGFSELSDDAIDNLSVKGLLSGSAPRKSGRNRTLPAPVGFKALEDAFNFSLEYLDDILRAVGILCADNGVLAASGSQGLMADAEVTRIVSKKLNRLGVSRWCILDDENRRNLPEDYFTQLRRNPGLFEVYRVLMGSIQVIIGILMARRTSELLELQLDCLIPRSDPTSPENRDVGYSLVFDNRKSGEAEEREQLARPILLSGAKLIWKLQQFHGNLSGAMLIDENACLFLNFNIKKNLLEPITNDTYRRNLDLFCDYFETKTIVIQGDHLHRYYIRQHQLRRFFAMAFFWGSGYDGLDTLRWFLGHTDAEHLWHYITENTSGVVLRGVKAETIVHGINRDEIEGIEKLRELLKKRFSVDDVLIESLFETIEAYQNDEEDGYISVEPPISDLKLQLDQEVDSLLSDGVIDLQPTFCTIQDKNGETIQTINLILIIKEESDVGQ